MVKKIGLIALLLFPAALIAQNPESAIGGEASVSAGAEYSTFNPDWGCPSVEPFGCNAQMYGPTAVFNFDLHQKYGIEGEARWLRWGGLGHMVQSNYMIGPRYRLAHFQRLTFWGKLGLGGAWITTPYYPRRQPEGQLLRLCTRRNARLSVEPHHHPSRRLRVPDLAIFRRSAHVQPKYGYGAAKRQRAHSQRVQLRGELQTSGAVAFVTSPRAPSQGTRGRVFTTHSPRVNKSTYGWPNSDQWSRIVCPTI